MNLKNLKTRNGLTIENATRVGDFIVGLVNNRPLTWQLNGRRTSNRRSQLDISLSTYLVIRKWGGKYTVTETTNPDVNKGRSVVKVIEL